MSQESNPLSRWSRLKHEQRKLEQEKQAQAEKEKPLPESAKASEVAPPLPPVEGLTPQSDFSVFMHPKVQDSLRRVALKKLFDDPHFNVPDLNEAYSGDWTVGEPISAEMLKQLNQTRTLLFTDEEREKYDREQFERDHEEALALDAERTARAQPQLAVTEQDTKRDELGRQNP